MAAVRRALRLLHSLDVSNTPADRAAVLSGLRSEVDTLAVLAGLPLVAEVVAPPNNPLTSEDVPIPFPV